jgi:hypothetical protein
MKDHNHSKLLFEGTANYDGPHCEMCIQSYQTLIRDLAIQVGINIPAKSLHTMDKAIAQFTSAFFTEVSKKHSGTEVKQFAEDCKLRNKELLSVANMLAVEDYSQILSSLYLVTSDKAPSVTLADLRYMPKSLKGILVYLREEGLLLDSVGISKQPRIYIYLYKWLFEVTRVFGMFTDIRDSLDHDAKIQMYLLPVSLGQLFERLNPTDDIMDEYAEDLLSVLESPSTELSQSFLDLFNQVKGDILNPKCRKSYVQDFKKALRSFKIKGFNVHDYYATLKSSTSRIMIDGKWCKFPSFVSSLFETDELRGSPEIQKFDQLIGYKSAYLSKDEQVANNLQVITDVVETKMIPNPSKYKPRGIHIGSNSLQDRCNWFHNQLQPFLFSLESDCMIRHQKGVDFLMKITSSRFRNENQNSIFVSDFSNATDTLSQEFQCLCLGILFPNEVVEFWRYVSQLPKQFYYPGKGQWKYYIQETGQPQGLLGSFDAFSLAHHILMLMLMKCTGLESTKATDFYRILGDDSIISYPTIESTEDLYTKHTWLCTECSLRKNDSKTAKSFYNVNTLSYPDEILDFAKVSVSRGNFLTPLPVGLGIFYDKDPAITNLSAILWYSYHKVTFRRWAHHVAFKCYGKNIHDFLVVESILTSGQIEYLSSFKDEEVFSMIDSALSGASIYSYGLSEYRSSLLGYFISDEKKQSKLMKSVSFENVWKGFFPASYMDQWSNLISKDHKFWLLLEEATDLASEIQALYELGDVRLATCIAALCKRINADEDIEYMADWVKSVEEGKDTGELWTHLSYLNYDQLFKPLKGVEQLSIRSLREKSKTKAGFLYQTTREFRRNFRGIAEIDTAIKDSQVAILDYMIANVYENAANVVERDDA